MKLFKNKNNKILKKRTLNFLWRDVQVRRRKGAKERNCLQPTLKPVLGWITKTEVDFIPPEKF